MSDLLFPSQALDVVLDMMVDFKDLADDEVLEVDSKSASSLYLTIAEVRKACRNMEHELQIHRRAEAAENGKRAVDQLATDQLIELVVDPEGKVIRPDFGKGGQS